MEIIYMQTLKYQKSLFTFNHFFNVKSFLFV